MSHRNTGDKRFGKDVSASTVSLPHLLKPSLRQGDCGLNGDVISAQGKSILHLHMCEADRNHKWIARGPSRSPA